MDDPFGLIPPDIRAKYEKAEWVEKASTAGRALEKELKSIYGREMEVVIVGQRVKPGENGVPETVVPGCWHVRRNNPPPALPTYMAILNEDGGYREPDARVIAELEARNLRNPKVMQETLSKTRTDQPHLKPARDLYKEQRHDQLNEDFRAARRVRGEGGLKKGYAGKR